MENKTVYMIRYDKSPRGGYLSKTKLHLTPLGAFKEWFTKQVDNNFTIDKILDECSSYLWDYEWEWLTEDNEKWQNVYDKFMNSGLYKYYEFELFDYEEDDFSERFIKENLVND